MKKGREGNKIHKLKRETQRENEIHTLMLKFINNEGQSEKRDIQIDAEIHAAREAERKQRDTTK
jgi:hypothetical protein